MLNPYRTRLRRAVRRSQQGVVLLVALIVLVALTMAGIALIRSVDTTTLLAGNLAFQQAALHASDTGVEAAIAVLKDKGLAGTLGTNDATNPGGNGYFAQLQPATDNPVAGQSWQAFWETSLASHAVELLPADPFGNRVYFVIHRQCLNTGPGAGAQCIESPVTTTATGNSQEAGEVELESSSKVYYRITVRVSGPRRTESYVQTHVSL
jgi:type IV pilus assembly protein PilX